MGCTGLRPLGWLETAHGSGLSQQNRHRVMQYPPRAVSNHQSLPCPSCAGYAGYKVERSVPTAFCLVPKLVACSKLVASQSGSFRKVLCDAYGQSIRCDNRAADR
ncbi:Uncharacterised protein [Vibrio cholerae]|nr:Uncharacterised protein [Vibrio cholerae]CSC19399.1 Uncharacterised protein [Vibrio cholerae]CSC88950.1 Uncharacterised protein [Vibrio cholerae]